MLIKSPRHRPEDLAIWSDMEEIDAMHIQTRSYQWRIGKTMDAIRVFVNAGRPYFLGTSWGKDSVVLLAMFYVILNRTVASDPSKEAC